MSKIVAIVPARWGSTRFPGKPLHLVAGKPLLRHVWERARRAKSLDAVIVATDDMRIAEAAFEWGAEVAVTSPRHVSGTDRIAEVASKARQFSFVVNIQGDEPLIEPRLIDRLAKHLRNNADCGMITAAHPFTDSSEVASPHQVKVVLGKNSEALYFSRAAIPFVGEPGAPCRFLRHQGIYGYRREVLLQFVRWKPTPLERAESLEQLRALENGVRIHVLVTKSGTPGVDTPEDAAKVDRALRARSRNREATHRARRSRPT